jgi:molybdopterin synthase catalytic subunit
MRYLTREPIAIEKILGEMTAGEAAGASVTFFGKIRNNPLGRRVESVEYEAFEPLAEKTIGALIEEAIGRWQVQHVYVRHRTGTLKVGDIAVAIIVLGRHREETYQASRFLIDAIKHRVPIWKKEFFEDGTSEWGQCSHPQDDHAREGLRPLRSASFEAAAGQKISLMPAPAERA